MPSLGLSFLVNNNGDNSRIYIIELLSAKNKVCGKHLTQYGSHDRHLINVSYKHMLRRENINSPNTSLTLVEFGHISFWLLISLQLLYRVVLVPPVEHNELVSRTYPYTPSFWTSSPFRSHSALGRVPCATQ